MSRLTLTYGMQKISQKYENSESYATMDHSCTPHVQLSTRRSYLSDANSSQNKYATCATRLLVAHQMQLRILDAHQMELPSCTSDATRIVDAHQMKLASLVAHQMKLGS